MKSVGYTRGHASRLDIIEQRARRLQIELWNRREQLWNESAPNDPIGILEPGVALRLNGYQIQTVDSLGNMHIQGKRTRIAGLLDRGRKIVHVSGEFPNAEQLFTAAHELGHVVLNHHGESLHRDRPMGSTARNGDPQEKEADWFAACFLMPRKQVHLQFRNMFLTDRFVLDDDTAFALGAKSLNSVLHHRRTQRDLSLTLAQAISYSGRQRNSLVETFRVSATAMAYRLEQLGLVADPL